MLQLLATKEYGTIKPRTEDRIRWFVIGFYFHPFNNQDKFQEPMTEFFHRSILRLT